MCRNYKNKYINFELPKRCASIHNKHHNFLKIAAKEAQKSSMHSQHGAVIVHKGCVIALGYNKKYKHFGLKSIHAEVDALNKLNKSNKKILRESVIYIVRVGGPSIIKNSRPCSNCSKIITKWNLKAAYWSTDAYDNGDDYGDNYTSDSDTSCDN